tara:strand:+ start:1962 stop:2627 length:666 start_codon:yes stop_codon:yes gene_type:complete
MIKNIEGILFDMDGTVLDSEGLFDEAQILFLKEYNINVSSNQLEEFKGMSYKDFYPRFIDKFNIDEDVKAIRLKIRTYLHEIMEKKLKFIDGFEEFYKSFIKNSGLKVALVTNTTRISYQKIQTCINIDDYFDFVITVTEAIEPKPSPMPYIQAMKHLSLNPNNTVIVEDSRTGLLSGIKTNAKVIGLTTSLKYDQIKDIDDNILIAESYIDIAKFFSIII